MAWAVWALTAAAAATPPGPPGASDLVGRLGGSDYQARERADRDLRRMGRSALPALAAGLMDPDPEVRARCERLHRVAAADDLAARLAAFRADPGGAADHGLPGWAPFRAVVGDDPAARELFARMSVDPDNAAVLRAAAGPPADLGRAVAARRARLAQIGAWAVPDPSEDGPVYRPALPDVATLLLAESLVPEKAAPYDQLQLRPDVYFARKNVEGPSGPAFGKLARRWLDTRDGPVGLSVAVRAAVTLGLSQADITLYAARVLAGDDVPPPVRAAAIERVARSGGVDHLPTLEALFGDATVLRPGGRGQPRVLVQDAALAAALVMSRQPPGDYGMTPVRSRTGTEFRVADYGFRDDEGGTAAGKRAAALRKWNAERPRSGPNGVPGADSAVPSP